MTANSDVTFLQPPPDEAPPYHEAILMDAPVIGKKREAAPITSVNTLKSPVYRRKFNRKLSILVLALVLIAALAVFSAAFFSPKKPPPITPSIRNQRRESRSERERGRVAVNYGVTPARMPPAKVDKQTGTDFHFDEPQNGAAVNSADERPVRNNPPMAHAQPEIATECRRSLTSAPVDQWPSQTGTFDTENSNSNSLNNPLNTFSSDTASRFNFVNMADMHPEPAQSPQTLAPQPEISSGSTQVNTISFSSSSSVQSYEMDLPMYYPLPFANLSDEDDEDEGGEDEDSSSSSSESEENSDHQRSEIEQMRSHDRRI